MNWNFNYLPPKSKPQWRPGLFLGHLQEAEVPTHAAEATEMPEMKKTKRPKRPNIKRRFIAFL